MGMWEGEGCGGRKGKTVFSLNLLLADCQDRDTRPENLDRVSLYSG